MVYSLLSWLLSVVMVVGETGLSVMSVYSTGECVNVSVHTSDCI